MLPGAHRPWRRALGGTVEEGGHDPRLIDSTYESAFWADVWETSAKPTDIFQGLIVKLSHQYTWNVAKVFFRKYLAADEARDKDNTAKKKQAVRYLAEAAQEVAGGRDAYDYVVSYLTQGGFPNP